MKTAQPLPRIAFLIALALILVPLIPAAGPADAPAPPPGLAGTWEGSLVIPGGGLRMVFHIAAKPDGTYTATLDSPDQGAKGIPVDKVTVGKKEITLEVKVADGFYTGLLKADGTISGSWYQSGSSMPLTLKRGVDAPGPGRPQEPKPPFPYRAEEVTYAGGKAGVTLAGTLAIPEGPGPFPAVLLVAGSGPMDRDETVFGHKPFLVLADALARRGVVVLRSDKRGIGKSTGDVATATDADFAADAAAGVAFLKARKEVNPKALGIVGHSEGGLVAPRVAAGSTDVAFIVLLAAPGVPGEQIILAQQRLLLKASGADEEAIKAKVEVQKKILAVALQEKDDAAAEKQIMALLKDQIPPGTPDSAVSSQVKGLLSPWYRDFLVYDPRPALTKVACPVLALGGDKDLQVPAVENLLAIRDALKSGGNTRYTVKVLPGLNHLFQIAETGSPVEYGRIEQTISPEVLTLVGDYIVARGKAT